MDPLPLPVGFVPVYFALPCQTCEAPGSACQHCGGICCLQCSQTCATQLQGGSHDSPRLVDSTPPGTTGGTEDNQLNDNTVYSLLDSLFVLTNHWALVEDSLYMRSQPLPELGVCYITDDECNTRPLGTLSDFIRIGDVLSYQHAALVLFNLADQKTFILESGKQPYRAAPKSALRFLRSSPTGLGVLMSGEEVRSFAYIEAWWSADGTRPLKKNIVRDRMTMAVIRSNNHVEYWWP